MTELVIGEDRLGFYIAWIADGDEGAQVGERGRTRQAPERGKRSDDEYECAVADWAAEQSAESGHYSAHGYRWESRKQAQAAMRAIKAALKSARADKPWPEWAIQASAAGWKPPRGWRP